MLMKLKVVYALTEKLYTGTQRALVAISNGKKPPTFIKAVLEHLSTVPGQIEEMKLSAARSGAITALSRAKAWQSELDPNEMAGGCSELKDDGTIFEEADFARCMKEMRPLACQLAREVDLTKYQPAYDSNNARIKAPSHDVVDLTPPRHKHTFAPDIDPAPLINDEAIFEALTGIDWTSGDFQISSEDLAQDDPETSNTRRQDDTNPAGSNQDGTEAGLQE